ncbi:MAG TPA: DUF3667 domain-containing protein, partial [Flavisolibacter sp.]|nr:DUF3667 domain-containing protein [Flavisolibacter sp.]
TIKTMFQRPGQLSKDYCSGIRKKYYPPLSLFLLLVILYLLFPMFKGLNMVLEEHMGQRLYGEFATEQIEALKMNKGWTQATTQEHFHKVSERTSKFLLFLVIPFFASMTTLFFRKRKKVLYDHVIFSTEANSFFLLWGFIVLPVFFLFLYVILRFFGYGQIVNNEIIMGQLIIIPFILFLQKAICRFYFTRSCHENEEVRPAKVKSWLIAIFFALTLLVFLLTAYKFLLFVVTLFFLR